MRLARPLAPLALLAALAWCNHARAQQGLPAPAQLPTLATPTAPQDLAGAGDLDNFPTPYRPITWATPPDTTAQTVRDRLAAIGIQLCPPVKLGELPPSDKPKDKENDKDNKDNKDRPRQ